jgi:hypothetical protein
MGIILGKFVVRFKCDNPCKVRSLPHFLTLPKYEPLPMLFCYQPTSHIVWEDVDELIRPLASPNHSVHTGYCCGLMYDVVPWFL